jgi:hypothetical protein
MQGFFLYLWLVLMGSSAVNVANLIDFAEMVTYFFTWFVCTVKCFNLYLQVDELNELLDELKMTIHDYEVPGYYMEKHLKFAKTLLFLYWLPTFSTAFLGAVASFILFELSYPMWFPYSLDSAVTFIPTAIYQLIETILYSSANVMMDTLGVLLMTYLIAMLNDLSDRLRNLKKHKLINSDGGINMEMRTDNMEKFLICVNYHRKIFAMAKKTEKIFSKMIAIQGFFSSIILCTATFALTMLVFPEDIFIMMKFATYMMAMICQIAISCYYGALLSLEYDKISQAIFHSEWMFEDQKYRNNMKIFVENAKRPYTMTAFGIYDINLITFGRILNSAYSLFAVFNRVN